MSEIDASKVVGFVKEFLIEDSEQNPYVFIAAAIHLPVPEDPDDLKLSSEDLTQYLESQILSSGELAEEYKLWVLGEEIRSVNPALLTTDPYKDLVAEPEIVIEQVDVSCKLKEEEDQTPLEARLQQLKLKANSSPVKGQSYFKARHTNHVHNYLQNQKAISARMSKGRELIDTHSHNSAKVVEEAGRALKLI